MTERDGRLKGTKGGRVENAAAGLEQCRSDPLAANLVAKRRGRSLRKGAGARLFQRAHKAFRRVIRNRELFVLTGVPNARQ